MVASASPQQDVDKSSWLGVLLASLAVLLALRGIALHYNSTDLFFDEAQYWSWSLEPAFGYYSKPPLIAWIIRIATETCGPSEFCVRSPAPLIHTATALIIFALAARLYDARTGFWSALVFATLPGISLSAGIISTDVPVLFCWALALYGFTGLIDSRSWWPAVVLGLALGLGLNAKYAMAYFVLCAAVYIAVAPQRRWLARDPRMYVALAMGLALIAPNLIWNASNSFATFAHTADNANWTGALANPGKALEFFGSQIGVFGPILFGAFLLVIARSFRQRPDDPDLMLLCFAVPVLAIITVQAFLSRAHANWAAVSYVSATVLVTATMIRNLDWGWLRGSFALHLVVLAIIATGTAVAGKVQLPGVGDPFARMLGWRELAEAASRVIDEQRRTGQPIAAVMTDDRSITATLLYYMRDKPIPVLAWRDGDRPRDHYELTRAFGKGSPEPILLVTLRRNAGKVGQLFASAEKVAERDVPAGAGPKRSVTFFRLSGYRGG